MAIGDIFTAPVQTVAAGGRGLCRVGGRAVFAALTAPGDIITGRITAEHTRWAEAELVDLREASLLRAKPCCPVYGSCGGCSLQHLGYEAQLEIKRSILCETFTRAGVSVPDITVAASPPWEYRNRLSFHAAHTISGGSRVGFKARRSADIVFVDDCPVADPAIRARLRQGALNAPPGRERFTVYAKDGVFLSGNGDGKSRGTITLGGKTLALDAGLFFQSNALMLERLLPRLRAAAEGAPHNLPMADLYAGAGTFSVFLADLFPGADLLEQNGAALELARQNLSSYSGAFRYYAESDGNWAKRRGWGRRDYGFAVADPPRRGLSPVMARFLAESGPPVLAYVSCDAASLARDSRAIAASYYLKELTLFDFYPQTAHIESLALFYRKILY
jgi:23S rRNA (uracil1939-C5)-methyltransferase